MTIAALLMGLVAGAAYATWRLKGSQPWLEALRALHPRAPRPRGDAETAGGGGGPQEPL